MKRYLVSYQAQNKDNLAEIAYGDIEIEAQGYLRGYDDLKTTRKIIAEKMHKNADWNVVILNIIRFPVK